MPTPSAHPALIRPSELIRTLSQHRRRWLIPTLVTAALALGFAVFRAPQWEATQALVVRDEAAGKLTRPGRFGHPDEMKTVQETILELARSRSVAAAALAEVGTRDARPATDRHVETLQDSIKLLAPKGSEFGKTEMFYLKLQDADRRRALALASAVTRHLQSRFEELRLAKARSVTDELSKTVALARNDLSASTAALVKVEREVGSDLAELRNLSETPIGDGSLRRSLTDLETELRSQRSLHRANVELLAVLRAAQLDPRQLLATPSRLLDSQPSLRRLKDGVVDAQLVAARLQGSMLAEHPLVQAAAENEAAVRRQLHGELATAIKGVELESQLSGDRVAELQRQQAAQRARLDQLAGRRAEYANLVADVRHRSEIVKNAEQELADARATLASAHKANLLTLIDEPDAGTRPVGPGRTTIVLGGALAGLCLGLAIVFLTVPPALPATTVNWAQGKLETPAPPMTVKSALRRLAGHGRF